MDVDTSRYMSLRAAEYLRYAKECAELQYRAERRRRNRAAQAVLREHR